MFPTFSIYELTCIWVVFVGAFWACADLWDACEKDNITALKVFFGFCGAFFFWPTVLIPVEFLWRLVSGNWS